MKYVALLRGINVGGNSKVDMKTLKSVFEDVGLEQVKTYINSGNVLFADGKESTETIEKKLMKAIEKKFGFFVPVIVKSEPQLKKVVTAIPEAWKNDADQKCDVIFLWQDIDKKTILEKLPSNPEVDTIKYVSGAVLWAIDRKHATRSRINRLIGTKLYAQMTVRNCNTARKLLALMGEMK